MDQDTSTKEKMRLITNIVRTVLYTAEQVTMGSENWRINNNMRDAAASIMRYIEKYPD